MTGETEDEGYRPTDYLAICKMSYGYGVTEESAIKNALRFAGPFTDEESGSVDVVVWKLYADSWESHGLSGPERGAEQLGFARYDVPLDEANDVHERATEAQRSIDSALHEADVSESGGDLEA